MSIENDKLAQSIRDDSVINFRKIIKNRLNELYNKKSHMIYEEVVTDNDFELSTITEIENMAKSYGGYDFTYEDGVLEFKIPYHKESLSAMLDYLDENDNINDFVAETDYTDGGNYIDLDTTYVPDNTIFYITIELDI